MWTRKDLKDRAKNVLRRNYWKALLISIVIALAQGAAGGSNGRGDNGGGSNGQVFSDFVLEYLPLIITAGITLFIFFIALRVLLGYPLEVGGRKYFIESAVEGNNQGCFKYAFQGDHYKGIVWAMLRRDIQTFLWTLLLIIPGIIKYYSYIFVPYIMADNPQLSGKEAIEISKQMTDGHKFNIFVLDLSFLGWFILGAIAFGIGIFFVLPYYNATYAELYLQLSKRDEIYE
ncbi:MAG: DUF975 family protein [Clostridia bacterium]|jgi:uncharacterized membrane protein|nr:DUF975 family protein [Clostridia bacterium]